MSATIICIQWSLCQRSIPGPSRKLGGIICNLSRVAAQRGLVIGGRGGFEVCNRQLDCR